MSSLKKLLIVYVGIVHLLFVYVLFKPVPVPTYPQLQHQIFTLAEIPPGSTVFLGDSLTAGLGMAAFTPGVNLALPGDTTKGLAQRMQDYRLSRAGTIVLMIGTNDPDGEAAFDSIAQRLPRVPIIWYAIPPIDPTIEKARTNSRIAELNRRIETLCASIDGCTFATLPLAGPDGRLAYHVGDGLHLSEEGYEIWRRDLRPRLAALRNEPPR